MGSYTKANLNLEKGVAKELYIEKILSFTKESLETTKLMAQASKSKKVVWFMKESLEIILWKEKGER